MGRCAGGAPLGASARHGKALPAQIAGPAVTARLRILPGPGSLGRAPGAPGGAFIWWPRFSPGEQSSQGRCRPRLGARHRFPSRSPLPSAPRNGPRGARLAGPGHFSAPWPERGSFPFSIEFVSVERISGGASIPGPQRSSASPRLRSFVLGVPCPCGGGTLRGPPADPVRVGGEFPGTLQGVRLR